MHFFSKSGKTTDFLKKLYESKKLQIEQSKKTCEALGLSTVLYSDREYPCCFKNLEKPPWVLTYRGNLQLLRAHRKISLVGSRRADPEVLYWLNKNLKSLSKDTVLVSGGAVGVDQEVHKVAFREGMSTVVVLPVGLRHVYPGSLKPLMSQFLKTKPSSILIVSQFHPDQNVFKASFYPRNYVLASISEHLVVVQSQIKSGTMVTAKYALENGKEIFTLPAAPWDSRYSGNLKLLEDGAHQLIDLTLIQK